MLLLLIACTISIPDSNAKGACDFSLKQVFQDAKTAFGFKNQKQGGVKRKAWDIEIKKVAAQKFIEKHIEFDELERGNWHHKISDQGQIDLLMSKMRNEKMAYFNTLPKTIQKKITPKNGIPLESEFHLISV